MPASPRLQATFKELSSLDSAQGAVRTARGAQFERLLYDLLTENGLDPRTRYRPAGEEIDGSFVLDGRVYLLEAKWQAKPLPASSIYAFRGKVDGKLSGTIGAFFSMSGYSPEAVDALTFGKHLNVVLVDREDIGASLEGDLSLAQILRQKLRVAVEKGNIYLRRDAAAQLERLPSPAAIQIIAEGPNDALLLGQLAKRLVPKADVVSVPAGGKLATASLANALISASTTDSRCLVVVDGDGDPLGSLAAIEQQLSTASLVRVIVADPSVDDWLEPQGLGRLSRVSGQRVRNAALQADLQWLRIHANGFADFEAALR